MKIYIVDGTKRREITLDDNSFVGEGAVGTIWRIDNGNVVKIYRDRASDHRASKEKLLAMIDQPPKNIQQKINGNTYTLLAWPTQIVEDNNGECIGFVMPELDFKNSLSLNPYMYPNEAKQLTKHQNSLNYRYQLAANISSQLADIHSQGHAVIDFKEDNIRLVREALSDNKEENEYKGFIAGFIDCDSFLVTDRYNKQYPCTVLTPEITSPEFHEYQNIKLLNEYHDRFVLAIQIFKILNYGIHPFVGLPRSERVLNKVKNTTDSKIEEGLYAYAMNGHPEVDPVSSSIHDCWDDKTREMFDKAFLSKDPKDRPSAQDWEDHLRSLIHERKFQMCKKFPKEISHIHIEGKPCYRCKLDSLGVQDYSEKSHLSGVLPLNNNTNNDNPTPWKKVENDKTSEDTVSVLPPTQGSTPDTGTSLPKPPAPTKRWWIIVLIILLVLIFGGFFFDNMTKNRSYTSEDEPSPPITNTEEPINPVESTVTEEPKVTPSDVNTDPIDVDVEPEIDDIETTENTTVETTNDTTDIDGSVAQIENKIEENRDKDKTESLDEEQSIALYAKYLNLEPEFLKNVLTVSESSYEDLKQLIEAGSLKNEFVSMSLAIRSFRNADLSYFRNLPKNLKVAREYNERAKVEYWEKKNPSRALYYQTLALKNNALNSEIAANLAFYLHENNLPGDAEFALYAMQLPRAEDKIVSTFMVELLADRFVSEGEDKYAEGALLAAFYAVEEKAKRCRSMLKYPKSYPKLKTVAEKTFQVISEQVENGSLTAPEECLPPLEWTE